MTFPNGLKRICDICYYMTFATLIASFLGSENLIITLPVFASVAFLSAFLAPRGRIKYISLIPLFLIFLIVQSTVINLIVFIPTVFYMMWAMPKKDESTAGFNYEAIFNGFLKAFGTILVIRFGLLGIFEMQFPTDTMLFATAFLILAIIFTRMIRHDENILNETRFKLINLISVVGVILGIVVVTSRTFLEIATTIYLFIAPYLIYLLMPIMYLIAIIFEDFEPKKDPAAMMLRPMEFFQELAAYLNEESDPSEVVGYILVFIVSAIVIIVVLYILYKLIKALLTKILGTQDDDIEDEIIPLDDKKKRRLRRYRENQIRELYRNFLILTRKNEIDTSVHLTSKEIENQVVSKFKTDTSGELRDEYIKIRYKEDKFTKADVKRVKELYKNVKEEIESFS